MGKGTEEWVTVLERISSSNWIKYKSCTPKENDSIVERLRRFLIKKFDLNEQESAPIQPPTIHFQLSTHRRKVKKRRGKDVESAKG